MLPKESGPRLKNPPLKQHSKRGGFFKFISLKIASPIKLIYNANIILNIIFIQKCNTFLFVYSYFLIIYLIYIFKQKMKIFLKKIIKVIY